MRTAAQRGPFLQPMTRLAALALGVVGVIGPGPGSAAAQISPAGDEFQVNTYTTSTQLEIAVASDDQGNFIVLWSSVGSDETDASAHSVQARRYTADGIPLGDQFQVNSYTSNSQQDPAVASDAQGNFVVAWTSLGSNDSDSSSYSVHAQLYDSNGNPLGGEFQVNTFTTNYQLDAAVASDPAGNFVVVWRSNGSSGTDTDQSSIQAQRYAANGAPLGSQFQVNTFTPNKVYSNSVATDANGNFVVVWASGGSSGTDTSARSVLAQRFDSDGNPLSSEFQVNTYTSSHQDSAGVASDDQGNFVVAFRSYGSTGTDGDVGSIQARRYDATGAALGGQFQVNVMTTGSQLRPAIASDAQGNFVVTWGSYALGGPDLSGASIQARRYKASGAALSGEFQVNTYTTSYQRDPAVAGDPQGNFVIAWGSDGSSGGDTSYFSVQAQRFDGLFRDGFETGDTTRWSATVP